MKSFHNNLPYNLSEWDELVRPPLRLLLPSEGVRLPHEHVPGTGYGHTGRVQVHIKSHN